MPEEKRFLVDVGMRDLPFPIRACSRQSKDGQPTVANISLTARIMQEFQARWIDKFIEIVHAHRDNIGTASVRKNILVYLKELKASHVRGGFEYPFFYEKKTPIKNEKCLVQYKCRFEAEATQVQEDSKVRFHIEIPCITTYPASMLNHEKGLFGQLSIFDVEVETQEELFPEDIVDLVDRHALAPMYSYLSREDREHLIEKVHTDKKTSVEVLDEVRQELAKNKKLTWYGVKSRNYGMLHTYSTVIGTEKSMWVPMSGFGEEDI